MHQRKKCTKDALKDAPAYCLVRGGVSCHLAHGGGRRLSYLKSKKNHHQREHPCEEIIFLRGLSGPGGSSKREREGVYPLGRGHDRLSKNLAQPIMERE